MSHGRQNPVPVFGDGDSLVPFTVIVPNSVQELTIDADIGARIELPPERHIEKEKIADNLTSTTIVRRVPQKLSPEAADHESEEL